MGATGDNAIDVDDDEEEEDRPPSSQRKRPRGDANAPPSGRRVSRGGKALKESLKQAEAEKKAKAMNYVQEAFCRGGKRK
jgi:hypothetical protein